MAVSGVERNRQAEETARIKSEYSELKKQDAKNQANQIKRLQKAHAEQLQELQEMQSETLDEQRNRAREALTERDQKYQKQIDELRQLHRESLKGRAEEFENKVGALRDTKDSIIERQRKDFYRKSENMEKLYRQQALEKDGAISELGEKSRAAQAEALDRREEVLREALGKKIKVAESSRDEEIERLSNDLTETRGVKNREIKNLKVGRIQDAQERDKDFSQQLLTERKNNIGVLDRTREGQQLDLQDQRKQYVASLKEQREEFDRAQNALTGEDGRLSRQIDYLEREIQREKNEANIRQANLINQARREKKGVLEATQNRIELMENERAQALQESKKQVSEDLSKVHKDLRGEVKSQRDYYIQRIDRIKTEQVDGLRNRIGELETESLYEKGKASNRINKIVDSYQGENQKQTEFHQQIVEQLKDQHISSLQDLRNQMDVEKRDAIVRLEKKIRENEIKHTAEINKITGRLEKQLAEVKAESHKALQREREISQTRLQNREKDFQQKLRSSEEQKQSQLDNIEERHRKDIETMKARYQQEQIENLKSRV